MVEYKGENEPLNTVNPNYKPPADVDLKFKIHGRPAFASVTVFLDEGQEVVGDGGALLWMDGNVGTELFCPGGCGAAMSRSWAGESCYMTKYTGAGYTTFSFNEPGDLLAFSVTPDHGWILTQKAYVAGTANVKVAGRFTGCCTSSLADEGLFFTKVTTKDPHGLFFAGGFGEIIRHDIPDGKTLYVDNGLFFAAHEKTNIKIKVLGGVQTCACGGEGVVMSFKGPTVVYTQSRDPALWDALANPPPPPPKGVEAAGAE
eukprot:scpid99461/ scgid33763/ 